MDIRLLKIILLPFFALLPVAGQAACNMGEDSKFITELNFGRLKLSGFPAGSLMVREQHALSTGDSWPFSLGTANTQLQVSIAAGASTASSSILKGTMKLTRPLKGYIIERIASEGCLRELRVTDDVLV